jgi:GlpG protein
MRFIGNLPTQLAATTFSDVLRSMGIDHQVESDGERWAVWVRSDEDFEQAQGRLRCYLAEPGAPEFAARAREGAVLRRMAEEDAAAPRTFEEIAVARRVFPHGVGALTAVLAGICIAIAFAALAGYADRVYDVLLMTHLVPAGRGFDWDRRLPEIFIQGEFWRIITPSLVHFNVAHLLLNLVWLLDLGSAIENREGTGRLGLLFVVIAIVSNFAQTWLVGPVFCGISGVLFGLAGYRWMKGKFDPGSGLGLHPYTVVLMMVFFIFGLGGLFTRIFGISMGNGAHAAGLAMGIGWGFLSSFPVWLRARRAK